LNKHALKDATDLYIDEIIDLIVKDLWEFNEEYKDIRKELSLCVEDLERIHAALSDTDQCILERFDDLKDRQYSLENRALLMFDKKVLRDAVQP